MKGKDIELPLVSVVITSYNRSRFIGKAISSALAQDYPNLEVVISENCSTDDSDAVIRQFVDDPRVKYFINEKNIGMIPNFIWATKTYAKGKYICYISSDDYLVNNSFISDAIKRIQDHPTVSIVTSVNLEEVTSLNEIFLESSYRVYKDVFYNKPFVSGKEVFLSFPAYPSISYGGTLLDRERLLALDDSAYVPISFDLQNILQMLLTGDAAFIDKNTYVAVKHGENAASTVMKAATYIDNLNYIDIPYQYALTNKLMDEGTLKEWRTAMYCYFCKYCVKDFYRKDKKQYDIFINFLKVAHPVVYKNITGNFEWITHYLLFANRSIGNAYLRSRSFLGKLKRSLKTRK